MKKIYQEPSIEVLNVNLDGILCQASAKYDNTSISKENDESLVKSQRNSNYKGNPVVWEDWQ